MYRLILWFFPLLFQFAWAENAFSVNPLVRLETEKGNIEIELPVSYTHLRAHET